MPERSDQDMESRGASLAAGIVCESGVNVRQSYIGRLSFLVNKIRTYGRERPRVTRLLYINEFPKPILNMLTLLIDMIRLLHTLPALNLIDDREARSFISICALDQAPMKQ